MTKSGRPAVSLPVPPYTAGLYSVARVQKNNLLHQTPDLRCSCNTNNNNTENHEIKYKAAASIQSSVTMFKLQLNNKNAVQGKTEGTKSTMSAMTHSTNQDD